MAVGRGDEAASRLDACLRAHGEGGAPLAVTLLHMGRTRVAAGMGDAEAYARHLAESIRWARRCHHASLIAEARRLGELPVQVGQSPSKATGAAESSHEGAVRPAASAAVDDETGRSSCPSSAGLEEAAMHTLEHLRRRSGAEAAYLFERRRAGLRLLAWTDDPERSERIATPLGAWAEEAQRGPPPPASSDASTHAATCAEVSEAEHGGSELRVAIWSVASEPRVVFVVSLVAATRLERPSDSLLASVAERLGSAHEGEASTVARA